MRVERKLFTFITHSKILYCHYPCKYLNSIHVKMAERAKPFYLIAGIFAFSELETLLLLRIFLEKMDIASGLPRKDGLRV